MEKNKMYLLACILLLIVKSSHPNPDQAFEDRTLNMDVSKVSFFICSLHSLVKDSSIVAIISNYDALMTNIDHLMNHMCSEIEVLLTCFGNADKMNFLDYLLDKSLDQTALRTVACGSALPATTAYIQFIIEDILKLGQHSLLVCLGKLLTYYYIHEEPLGLFFSCLMEYLHNNGGYSSSESSIRDMFSKVFPGVTLDAIQPTNTQTCVVHGIPYLYNASVDISTLNSTEVCIGTINVLQCTAQASGYNSMFYNLLHHQLENGKLVCSTNYKESFVSCMVEEIVQFKSENLTKCFSAITVTDSSSLTAKMHQSNQTVACIIDVMERCNVTLGLTEPYFDRDLSEALTCFTSSETLAEEVLQTYFASTPQDTVLLTGMISTMKHLGNSEDSLDKTLSCLISGFDSSCKLADKVFDMVTNFSNIKSPFQLFWAKTDDQMNDCVVQKGPSCLTNFTAFFLSEANSYTTCYDLGPKLTTYCNKVYDVWQCLNGIYGTCSTNDQSLLVAYKSFVDSIFSDECVSVIPKDATTQSSTVLTDSTTTETATTITEGQPTTVTLETSTETLKTTTTGAPSTTNVMTDDTTSSLTTTPTSIDPSSFDKNSAQRIELRTFMMLASLACIYTM